MIAVPKLQVVAALLEREGKFLICRRRPDQSHALQWEFPGGKVEPGESPPQAVTRELQEELGIADARGREIARYEYAYPGKPPVTLIFFRVESWAGEPRNLIFQEMTWETPSRLPEYDFVEGDRDFIRAFSAGTY